MKKFNIILLAFVLLGIKSYSENPSSSSFTKVKLGGVGKVYITQGDSNSVVINTDASRDEIHTKIKDDVLSITSEVPAEYHVTMKQIDELSVSGSGEIIVVSPITTDNLRLDVSGTGKMTVPMKVNDLHADIGGAGKMTLSGTATDARLDISGTGKIEASDLQIKNCRASISGVGKCNVDVTDSLYSSISGMGSIHYKEKPKYVSENVSGMGRVNDNSGGDSRNDTTRFTLGDADFLVISKDSTRARKKERVSQTKPIWQGFEIGFNNYFNQYGNTDAPGGYEYLQLNTGKSVQVSLNVWQQNVRLGHGNFWFFTGLGLMWNNYRFDKNVYLSASQSTLTGGYDTTSNYSYVKSKLTDSYLVAPVMFEWFSAKRYKDAFHIGAGGMLGYRIGSHTKQKYEDASITYKPKGYGDFYLNDFRYGARVAIGFGKVNVFGDYYFSELFQKNKGPVLYPFDFGITLIPF